MAQTIKIKRTTGVGKPTSVAQGELFYAYDTSDAGGTYSKRLAIGNASGGGNTPEIKALVPFIKKTNNKLIAITGETKSYLSDKSDIVISSYVDNEACPNNLAPTTSTTAQLVVGDAIAVCLVKLRGFSSDDFAKYQPGGNLGKRLFLKVEDLIDTNILPKVDISDLMKDVIIEISNKMLGIAAVLDENKIVGVITDGDLRRQLLKSQDISTVSYTHLTLPTKA